MDRQTIDEPIPIVNKMISTFGWIQTNNVTKRVIILWFGCLKESKNFMN